MPELAEGKSQLSTVIDTTAFETLKKLAKLEGKSQGDFIADLVVAFDAIEPSENDGDLPDAESTVVIAVPRDRDMLKEGFLNLVAAGSPFLHENYVLAAFSMARREYTEGLPEFKSAEKMRRDWELRRETRNLTYTVKGAPLK